MWPFAKGKADTGPRAPIARYKEKGEPFVLVLRNFRILVTHENDASGRVILWQSVREALPPGAGMLMVRNPADASAAVEAMLVDRADVPFVPLGDDWQEDVVWMIEHAALIVVEYYANSPGSTWELEQIILAEAEAKTILVLPMPRWDLPTLDDHMLVEGFYRCLYSEELGVRPILASFQARDLHARLCEIAAHGGKYKPNGKTPSRHLPPVTFEGVADGYLNSSDLIYSEALEQLKQGADPEWVAGRFHMAYWQLRRCAATMLQVGRQRPGTALTDTEVRTLMIAHLFCAETCTHVRMKDTFPSVEAQIGGAQQHAIYAMEIAKKAEAMDSAAKDLLDRVITRLSDERPFAWEAS